MTCFSLCLTFQAVVWVTPRRRPNSMLEIPCLLWVRWYMARNQVRSGSLVEAKDGPGDRRGLSATDGALEQAAAFDQAVPASPQAGQMNPSGHRAARTIARQSGSVPYRRSRRARSGLSGTAPHCVPSNTSAELGVRDLYRARDG